MSEYVLEAKNLYFSYMDGTKAIQDLSIKIPRGKKIAVVGNNGAGKTTLFLHFNGVHRPDSGEISFNGEVLNYSRKQLKMLRKNVGVVFQDPDIQLFSASVYQDVSFGPVNLGWPEEKVRAKIKEAMEKTGTWELKDRPTHFLSHGQKKRAAIAGVLVMEPEVVILDEPTAGLDPYFCGQMMQLLDEVNQNGTTILLSSHDLDEVYAWADYIFVMNNGQIFAQGLPEDIFRNLEVLRQANLIKPWVLDIYDQLVGHGMVPEQKNVPRNRDELALILTGLR